MQRHRAGKPSRHRLFTVFSDANNHDIEALMSFMTEDRVFHTVAGEGVLGNTIEAYKAVCNSFELVWQNFPDAAWSDPVHFVWRPRGE